MPTCPDSRPQPLLRGAHDLTPSYEPCAKPAIKIVQQVTTAWGGHIAAQHKVCQSLVLRSKSKSQSDFAWALTRPARDLASTAPQCRSFARLAPKLPKEEIRSHINSKHI